MQWIREKFGAVVVSILIVLIGAVFVVSGVFDQNGSGMGGPGGASAGKVNGESISMREFQQSLNQRLEFFKNMAGGKISDEQLKAFRVHESVFNELVQRKLLVQEARKQGLMASDEEVMQTIQTYPVFQKDGKFDLMTYKQVISNSPYGSSGNFEKAVREDLSTQRWNEFFRRRVQVSEEEAKREFMVSRDKRNVKYVLLTTENGRKGVEVKSDEIQKFLADSAKLNLAQSQYDAKKGTEYKGKTFEAVRESIAREILAGEKLADVQKVNEKLADQIQAVLTADKSSDAKVNALVKSYGAEVKTTGLFNRQNPYLPGIGEAKDLMADAFAAKSPIDPKQGGQAKKYQSASWVLVAILSESQRAEPSKFDAEREEMVRQISLRKQRELFEDWMKKLQEKAKIQMNKDVVGA